MAAEGKEVVMATHPLDPQQLAPQLRQRLLHRPLWRGVGTGGVGHLERRQRLAVQFPVGCEGQGLQGDEGRRHHVIRQLGREMAAQLRNKTSLQFAQQWVVCIGPPGFGPFRQGQGRRQSRPVTSRAAL